MFVRTELARLCEPTLHYTYIDGKSCIEEPNFLADGGNFNQSSSHYDELPLPELTDSVEKTVSHLKINNACTKSAY